MEVAGADGARSGCSALWSLTGRTDSIRDNSDHRSRSCGRTVDGAARAVLSGRRGPAGALAANAAQQAFELRRVGNIVLKARQMG